MTVSDRVIALASSLVQSPGVYVSVLGAGVSKAAGVPLASEISTQLINDLAAANGIQEFETWEAAHRWYEDTYGELPTYEGLLARLCPAPGDRSARLARYFKGTVSVESSIHATLAALGRAGLVRVFVTTNFDDLMEQALRAASLNPVTISSAADLVAARPLHIHDAVVIHVHGHWQNASSMRNTIDELGSYDEWITDVCRESLRGHGRLIVGWSGHYDRALRDLLREHATPTYSAYWMDRDPLRGEGKALADDIAAITIAGDAEGTLADVVTVVQRLRNRAELLTPATANVAKWESVLAGGDTSSILRALALAVGRIERIDAMTTRDFNTSDHGVHQARERQIAEATTEAATMIMFLALYGPTDDLDRWLQHAARLGVRAFDAGGSTNLIDLQRLPGLILLVAAAVGAAARNDADLLARVLTGANVPDRTGAADTPLAVHEDLQYVFGHQWGFTALCEYLKRLAVDGNLLTPAEFEEAWERAEIAWTLLSIASTGLMPPWLPHGRVLGRMDHYTPAARSWAARAYQLDVIDHSILIDENQREVASTLDAHFAARASRFAWSHLPSGSAGTLPGSGWRVDEHGQGAAPPGIRFSLSGAIPGASAHDHGGE